MSEVPSQPDLPSGDINKQLADELRKRQLQQAQRNQAIKNINQALKNTKPEVLNPIKKTPSKLTQALNSNLPGNLGKVKSPNVGGWGKQTWNSLSNNTRNLQQQAVKGINSNILKAEKWLSGERTPVVKSQLPKRSIPRTTTTVGGVVRGLGIAAEVYTLAEQTRSTYQQFADPVTNIPLTLVLGAGGAIPGIRDSKTYQELVDAWGDLKRERDNQKQWKEFLKPTEKQIAQAAIYPFTGGQSNGVQYRLEGTQVWTRTVDNTTYTFTFSGNNIVGQVGSNYVGAVTAIATFWTSNMTAASGKAIFKVTMKNSSTGNQEQVSIQSNESYSLSYIPGRFWNLTSKSANFVRVDGQPDTGGNPTPTVAEISGVTQPPPIPDPSKTAIGVVGSELVSQLAQILGIVPSVPIKRLAVPPRVPIRYPDADPNIPEQDKLPRDPEPDNEGKFFIPDIRPVSTPIDGGVPIVKPSTTSVGDPSKNENRRFLPLPVAVATGKPDPLNPDQIVSYSYSPTPSLNDPFGTPTVTPIKESDPNPTKSPSKTPVPSAEPEQKSTKYPFSFPIPLPIVGKADPVKGDPVNNKLTEPQSPNQPPTKSPPPATGTECPCNAPVIKNQDSMLQKLDAMQNAAGNALDAEILRKVNIIDDKVGDKVDGGLSGFLKGKFEKLWKSRVIDRALNLATFAVATHNGAMLSNNIKDTALYAIENVLGVIGIKDADDVVSSFNEAIGNTVENTIKSIIGADNYTNLVETWKKASRIYQAGTNILSTTLSIHQGLVGGLELMAKYNSRIGNALKASATINPNYYDWMEEEISLKMGASSRIQNFMEGLQNVEEVAEDIEGITSEAVNVKDDLETLKEQREQLDQALEDERTQKQEDEEQENEQSLAHSSTQRDLVKPNT